MQIKHWKSRENANKLYYVTSLVFKNNNKATSSFCLFTYLICLSHVKEV